MSNAKNLIEELRSEKEAKVQLLCKVPASLREEVRVACDTNSLKVTEFVTMALILFLKQLKEGQNETR